MADFPDKYESWFYYDKHPDTVEQLKLMSCTNEQDKQRNDDQEFELGAVLWRCVTP